MIADGRLSLDGFVTRVGEDGALLMGATWPLPATRAVGPIFSDAFLAGIATLRAGVDFAVALAGATLALLAAVLVVIVGFFNPAFSTSALAVPALPGLDLCWPDLA